MSGLGFALGTTNISRFIGRLIATEPTEAGKARQICDWLAGLTDGMIVRTYRRLFSIDGREFWMVTRISRNVSWLK